MFKKSKSEVEGLVNKVFLYVSSYHLYLYLVFFFPVEVDNKEVLHGDLRSFLQKQALLQTK